MKKITIDLDIMENFQISFEQYVVLYHLHSGDFEKTEDQWNIFDQDRFETRFFQMKKPGVQAVMVSLKHRKFIDLRPDFSFRCVNKKLFRKTAAEKLTEKNIFSFREKNPVFNYSEGIPSPILIRSTKVEKWRSPGFINAWNTFENEVRRKTHKKPLDQGMADRLISKLIRLSGDSEPLATLIIQQTNEESWLGFWPLDRKRMAAPADKKASDQKLASWYQSKT